MNTYDIKGKRAIVTGGAQGLSRSMAEGLLEAGASVVILDVSPKLSETVDTFCKNGYACYGLSADLCTQSAREHAFHEAVSLLGGLDILVNGAGIQRRHKSEEFPLEDWNLVLEINLTAVFSLCQLAAKEFLAGDGGKIINIASMISFFGGYTIPAYAASKGGIAQLTKAFANEWASHKINVNALAPGYMDTEMNTAILADEGRNKEITARIPAHRWGTGEDMKGPLLFLASAASDYLHGAIIPVDGGYLCR